MSDNTYHVVLSKPRDGGEPVGLVFWDEHPVTWYASKWRPRWNDERENAPYVFEPVTSDHTVCETTAERFEECRRALGIQPLATRVRDHTGEDGGNP